MTRDEHIRAAEELLAGEWMRDSSYRQDPTEFDIAKAQVHATLALAMTPAPEAPAAPVRVSRWRRKAIR